MPILSSSSGLSARALGLTSGIVAGPLTINSISGILNSTTGTQLSVSFSPGRPGSSPITNHQFSTDNGATFTSFSPAQTTSPLIISGLTNGTTYTVKIRSLQGNQISEASNAVTGRPVALPGSPTITTITNDANTTIGTHLSVAFTAGSAGTDATSSYQFSIDGGSTFTNRATGTTGSPLLITGLANATTYPVVIRAITSQGHASLSSNNVSGRPVALPGAPTITGITTTTGQLSIAFTAGSSGTDAASIYQYSLNNGSTFTNRATGTTASPIVVTGIDDATVVSGGYSVKVRQVTNQNHFSAGSTTVIPGSSAPGAPSITSTSKTPTSITVNFTSAVAGSYAIDRHERSLDGINYVTYTSGSAITGLSTSTSFTISIRAVDIQGVAGAISTITVTTDAEVAPSAPIIGATEETSTTSVTVAYTRGAQGTYAIGSDERQVVYVVGGNTVIHNDWAAATSPITVTGLPYPDYSYQVRVRSKSTTGLAGAYSEVSVQTAAPIIINSISGTSNSTTGTQLSVSFSHGNGSSPPVTNYQFSTNNGSTFTSFSPAQISSPLIISGLTNGTTYTVKIRSLQGSQISEASNAVTGRPVALPGSPTITAITNDANGTTGTHLSVAFTAGSAGTDAISNYQFSIDGGSTFTNRATGTTGSPLLITGLTNGTTYPVVIRAITSQSHASLSSNNVSGRPVALPGADTITGITASTGQLSIAFTAGASGTDARSTYQFSLNNGSTFANRATGTVGSPIVVTGITDATVVSGGYTVKIRSITNQNHLSANSNGVVPTPTPAAAPVITSSSKTPTSITVNFTSAVAGSYAINRHERSLDGTNWTTYTSGTAIPNLSTSTTYTVRIRAVDVQGVTGAISTTTVTTDAEVAPSAPVIGTTTELSTTSIRVAYTRGAQGTYAIDSDERQVFYYINNGYVLHSDYTTVTSPITVTGLPYPDYSYLVRIRSKSTTGLAGASTDVFVNTKAPVPSAPTLSFSLTSASERATASLSWTAPAYATKYHVYKNGVYLKEVTGTTTTAAVNEGTTTSFTVYAGNRHDQFSGVSNTKTMVTGEYLKSNTWFGEQGERMVIRTDAPPAGCSAPIRFSITVSSNTNDPGTAGYARIDTVSAAWRCGGKPAVGTTDYTAGQNADRNPLCNPSNLRLNYGFASTQAWGSTFDSFFITRSYNTGGVDANFLSSGSINFHIGAVAGKNLNSNCTVNNIGDYWIAKEFKAVGKITTATTYS
jgi:titin